MPTRRLPLVVATASALVLLSGVVVVPEIRLSQVRSAVGLVLAVHALALLLAAGAWYGLGRPPGFRVAVGIAAAVAAVVVLAVVPRSVFTSGLPLPSWGLVDHHLRWAVPMAFMLPLGVAATRRQRVGTVVVMVLPALWELYDHFFVSELGGSLTAVRTSGPSAVAVVAAAAFVFLYAAAAGAPLFVVGYYLGRVEGRFGETVRRFGGRVAG